MRHALVLLVLGACAGAQTQTVTLVVPVDASMSDADAAIIDAVTVDTARDAPQPTASEPWCNEKYDVFPCIFTAYGNCWLREKTPGDPASPYTFTYCPPGSPPSFMTKPRACGRRSTEPIVKRTVTYVQEPDRNRCSGIATKWANVAHEERSCTTDADCALVSRGCFLAGLTKTAAALPKYADQPCGNPAAGMCAPQNEQVHCTAGCCILTGMSPFGTTDAAYPKVTPP